MDEQPARDEATTTRDYLRIILGVPLALAALALGLFLWFGLPEGLTAALDRAPAWYSGLALGALLLDGLVLSFAVRRVARHRLDPTSFLARIEPALSSGGVGLAMRQCQATGPRGVARLLAAWLQTLDGSDEDRRQAVAEATLEAARDLEQDARAARWMAGLGALAGLVVASAGMLWSLAGRAAPPHSALPLLVTMVGLVLLLPALGCVSYVAASVSRSAGHLQAALPVIAGIGFADDDPEPQDDGAGDEPQRQIGDEGPDEGPAQD